MSKNEILYLAYGSNCNMKQMSYRCKGAEMIGKAIINGFRLAYRSGYLTLIKDESNSTTCAIWKLSSQNEKALDHYEGFPRFYGKYSVPITFENGEQQNALIYIMQPEFERDYDFPSRQYVDTCAQGYIDCGIDAKQLLDAYEEIRNNSENKKNRRRWF